MLNGHVWHYSSQSIVNIKSELKVQIAFQIKPNQSTRKEIGCGCADLGCCVEGSPIKLTVISDSEYELEMQLLLCSAIMFSFELSK